jgi:hypothetical protein
MPDAGTNTYLSIAPDGTVVTPTNIDPAGVISAGDLASQTDVNDAHDDAIAVAEAYADEGDATVQGNVDALSGDVVHGAGMQVSGQYSVDLNYAAGQLTGQAFDVDVPELADWTTWLVFGHFFAVLGHVAVSAVSASGTTLTLNFTEVSTGPEAILGTYYFRVLGTP